MTSTTTPTDLDALHREYFALAAKVASMRERLDEIKTA